MDWHLALGVSSGIVQFVSIIPYVWSMLKGATRPNIVSWLLWTILQFIAIFAQLSAGASWSLIILIAMTINTCLVLLLCFGGYGYAKYGWLDIACAAIAVAAIVLWQLTNEPLVALVLTITADLMASIPTIAKTYRDPYSENVLGWYLVTAAAALSVFSTTIINAENLIYPAYLFAMTGLIGTFAFVGQRRTRRSASR